MYWFYSGMLKKNKKSSQRVVILITFCGGKWFDFLFHYIFWYKTVNLNVGLP